MSFVDALPAFRMKQWQVVVLLLIDALSVCRIPALISYMTDRRALFHKVRPCVYIVLIYYFNIHYYSSNVIYAHEALHHDVRLHRYPDKKSA